LIEFVTMMSKTRGYSAAIDAISSIEQVTHDPSLVGRVVEAIGGASALWETAGPASQASGSISADAIEMTLRRADVFAPLRAAIVGLRASVEAAAGGPNAMLSAHRDLAHDRDAVLGAADAVTGMGGSIERTVAVAVGKALFVSGLGAAVKAAMEAAVAPL
jgi:hypothetical protein